jgi:uncharacterized membrane protein
MNEALVPLGLILIFVGILLVIFGLTSSTKETKFAFGGFIGPIPFGFANDPKLLWVVLTISVVLLVVFLLPLIKHIV